MFPHICFYMACLYCFSRYLHVENKNGYQNSKYNVCYETLKNAEIGFKTCYYLHLPILQPIFAPIFSYLNVVRCPWNSVQVLFWWFSRGFFSVFWNPTSPPPQEGKSPKNFILLEWWLEPDFSHFQSPIKYVLNRISRCGLFLRRDNHQDDKIMP